MYQYNVATNQNLNEAKYQVFFLGGGGITGNSFEHKTTKSGHEMPDLAFGYVYTTLNRILLRRHESHTDRASVQA